MANIKLFVFPLDLDDSDAFIRVAKALGIEIIGGSSFMPDMGSKAVDHFVRLPFITDPTFNDSLLKIINEYSITFVYAPHQGVWRHLDTLSRTEPELYSFSLCKPDAFTTTWQLFSPHEEWASSAFVSNMPEWIVGNTQVCPQLEISSYSALHRQFLNTPGQCDEEKLRALCDITRLLPRGDVLEVGCLYGRSAFALGYLASRHKVGSLICVDPWRIGELTDQGPHAAVLNVELDTIDFEKIFGIFLSTAALLDNVGYIRKTSESALPVYQEAMHSGTLFSPGLGAIPLADRLSLIHVDGNHRYDQVLRDVEIWSPYLAPGGWLLLDDYVWAFGDGPRRVGDEILKNSLYDSAFVAGDTLFLHRTHYIPTTDAPKEHKYEIETVVSPKPF